MGGYGSGRSGRRPIAEESRALRIGDISQAIALAPLGTPQTGTIRWRIGAYGRVTGACSYRVSYEVPGQRRLTLAYTVNGEPITDQVLLTSTRPHYGGYRWWFACRRCNRRVGVLFNPGSVWRCRHCWRITYRSSNESDRRVSALLRAGDLESLQAGSTADLILALKLAQRLRLR